MGINKMVLSEVFIEDLVGIKNGKVERVSRPGNYRMFKNEADNVIVEFFTSQKIKPL